MDYDFKRLTDVDDADAADLNRLLAFLLSKPSEYPLSHFQNVVEKNVVWVATVRVDGRDRIVGMAMLVAMELIDVREGRIEKVVVDPDHRGKGIGSRLMQSLIDAAKSAGLTRLELTSRPTREAANAMYQSLGFERRDTNVYRLTL